MFKKEFKIGIMLNYANIVVTMFSTIFLTAFIIRLLGSSEYGLYNLIGAFVASLTLFEFGISQIITRYVSKYNTENDKEGRENFLALVLIIYAFISLILLVFAIVFYCNIENIFVNSIQGTDILKAKIMFIFLTINILFTIIGSIFSAILYGNEKFIVPRAITLISNILKLILSFTILYFIPTAVALTIITVICGIAVNIINAYYAMVKEKVKIKLHSFDKTLFKEIIKYSSANFLQILAAQMYWKISQIIIGIVLTTTLVAIYSVAMQLNEAVLAITTVITHFTLPQATRLVVKKASIEEITIFTVKTARIIMILYLAILIGFTFFGSTFIKYWVGSEYVTAYVITLIVISSAAINRIQGTILDVIKAKNMQWSLAIVYLSACAVCLILTIIFINIWGLLGVAIATATSLILVNTIIANIYYQKMVGINVRKFFIETFRNIHIPIIVCICSCIILNLFKDYNVIIWFAKCIAFLIIYMLTIYIFFMHDDEKIFIRKFFLKLPIINSIKRTKIIS